MTLGDEPLDAMGGRQRARRIGYLPQQSEVAWDVTVRTLVALGRMPHGDRASAPVNHALAAMQLDHLAERPMSRISGGETARALLARVLAGQPEWILADEPLAALDLAHQLALFAHLRDAADGGAGVVIVAHDLALAMNHADRVLVLNDGASVAHASPERALSAEIIERIWGVTRPLDRHGGRARADRHGARKLTVASPDLVKRWFALTRDEMPVAGGGARVAGAVRSLFPADIAGQCRGREMAGRDRLARLSQCVHRAACRSHRPWRGVRCGRCGFGRAEPEIPGMAR